MQPAELNAMPVEVSDSSTDSKESNVARKTMIQRIALVLVTLLAFGAVALNSYEPSNELGSLRGSVMNMCKWWDAGTFIFILTHSIISFLDGHLAHH